MVDLRVADARSLPYRDASYDAVLEIAESAKGPDKYGYRAEFVEMVLVGAVRLGYRKELEAVPEGPQRQALFDELLARQIAQGAAIPMATTLEIDAVIDPADTRAWLLRGLEGAKLRDGPAVDYRRAGLAMAQARFADADAAILDMMSDKRPSAPRSAAWTCWPTSRRRASCWPRLVTTSRCLRKAQCSFSARWAG